MPDAFTDLDSAQQAPPAGPDPFADLDQGLSPAATPVAKDVFHPRMGAEGSYLAGMRMGAPVPGAETAKSVVLNTVPAAIGMTLGGVPGAMAGSAAGNTIDQWTRPGDAPFKWGEAAATTGLNIIPGASLAKAPLSAVAKQALKYAAAGVAAKNVETGIDERRFASGKEDVLTGLFSAASAPLAKYLDSGAGAGSSEAASNAAQSAGFIDKTKQMKEAGLLIPSMSNPATGLSDSPEIQSLIKRANHTEVEQAVVMSNSQRAGELTREYAGLPKDAPLVQKTFDDAALPAMNVYGQVAALSPEAALHLKEFQVARDRARSLWQDANAPTQSNRTALRDQAKDAEIVMQAKQFELMNDAHLAGRFDLMPQLTQAQKDLARNYAAQNATDFVRGEVDPRLFTKMKARGVPLDGPADLLADAAEAAPKWMKPASELNALRPAANMGTSTRFGKGLALAGKTLSAGVGATIGAQSGHAEAGAMAGFAAGQAAVPVKEALAEYAKNRLLKNAANPNYAGYTGAVRPEFMANLARYMSLQGGQRFDPAMLDAFSQPIQ